MPNWVEGKLKIRGKPEDIKRWVEECLHCYTTNWLGDGAHTELVKGAVRFERDPDSEEMYLYVDKSAHIEGTRRNFVEKGEYVDLCEEGKKSILVVNMKAAWNIEEQPYIEMSKKYNLDFRVYFPTGAGDIFKADKVITEYRDGDRKLAAFVAPRVGDIPMTRSGYEITSIKPAYIAPSRLLTLDELTKRGFGEAIYPGMDEQQRAARLLVDDMADMDARITRREEWMAAQTMINNGCDMVEYIDDVTQGDTKQVRFFTGEKSNHLYTVAKKWNETGGDYRSDVRNMCRMLSSRGLPAADLVLGTDAADYILTDEATQRLLDKNSGIITGEIRQQLSKYDGVVLMGTLNFGGFMLTVFSVDETYSDDHGLTKKYFPADAAMVTAPNCGHMMYGSITQMDYGQVNYSTYAAKRVPKFVVDQDKDTRKLRLGCRPLAAPKNKNPYIFAANVVG